MPAASPVAEPENGRPDLAALLSRVTHGDQVALAELYRATCRRVFGLALAIVRERQGAEEATLDAYAQVWQQAPAYAPARGAALTWILAIARSRALDLARAHARASADRAGHDRAAIERLTAELFTADADPLDRTVGAERGRRVREAVADLPRGQRDALTAPAF